MPTIAIFGAGPALGRSTALRFAGAGYDVALVGRNADTLLSLAAELQAVGANVRIATAELAAPDQALAALRTVGSPDVILYAPGDVRRLPVDARQLDAATLESWLPLNLLTPVGLAHAALPAMLERGRGAIVVAQGPGARDTVPALASSAVPQSALLHYLHALAAQIAGRGVTVASLLIGGLIQRSAAAALFDSGHFADVEPGELPRTDPDELAQRVWQLSQGEQTVEHRV